MYLIVEIWKDNERHEVLAEEDCQGEDVLHDWIWPTLNTHGVAC